MTEIRKVLRYRYESWQAARSMMHTTNMEQLMEEIEAEYEERSLSDEQRQAFEEQRRNEAER
jgi:hypothetical protein